MIKAICPAIIAGVLFASASAQAGLNSYLYVTGESQGDIDGSVTQAGRENSIEIYGFSHEVISPRDAASGRATGKRQHLPFTIKAPIDRSTPLLFNALATNENLPQVTLRLYRPSRSGKEEQYYTIELVNATVSSIKKEAGKEARDPHLMIVSFAYQQITETWEDGGIMAQDSAVTTRR